jgi:pyruvate dehydrogenase E1 component alpha subunit/2-oxoisovalerate dehydrogenase E1 component alpha subunit
MERLLDRHGKPTTEHPPDLEAGDLRAMYRAMRLVRAVDDQCLKLQRQGRVGFYGAATGEEAATVGSAYAFREDDWIFPALRQGGALLMRGFSLEDYFHHLFGTAEAVEKGRSMPCHYSDRRRNVVSWSSCMTTQLPQAVGAAYAADLQGDDTVMAAYLGDGATSEGEFHSAMNFAGVWDVPVVFVCHNNQYAISVPADKQTASETFAQKADAYGFPGVRVDGNDVLAVHQATREAVERARSGDGPTFIEAVTYRRRGHSTSDDPTKYRSEEEVEKWRKRDPLDRFRSYLEARDLWDEDEEQALVDQLQSDIKDAIETAEAAPEPDLETMVTDVYAEMPARLEEQLQEILRYGGDDAQGPDADAPK